MRKRTESRIAHLLVVGGLVFGVADCASVRPRLDTSSSVVESGQPAAAATPKGADQHQQERADRHQEYEPRFLEPGALAPEFALIDLTGRTIRLSALVAQLPTVIIFGSYT